jgi:hypothetical protein
VAKLTILAHKTVIQLHLVAESCTICSSRSGRPANESFENLEKFKHLGTTLTKQNDIHDEIKSRLNSGNACCHSVQNLLSFCLIQKEN